MDKQKGLAPILIVFLIAAAVGGYLVYTNYSNNRNKIVSQQTVQSTPVPTSQNESSSSAASGAPNGAAETVNWKVQKGEYYEFKYPDSWVPKPAEFYRILSFGPNNNRNIWWVIDENTHNNRPETLANGALGSLELLSRESITINQHPAIIQETKNKIGIRIEAYIGEVQSMENFFPEDGGPRLTKGTMSIFMEVRETDNTILNENRKIFNQILSTFKFIQ